MKVKTFWRLFGALEVSISGAFSVIAYKTISDLDYNKFFINTSLESKIASGIYESVLIATGIGVGLVVVDGIVDVTKGTHHYIIGKIYKKLARNKETKREIESYLEKSTVLRDEKFR
jgi:hypothetical protein